MAHVKKPTGETCDWVEEDHGDYWDTACGEAFTLLDGGPRENNMHFCPYCGRKLKARPVRN